MKPDARFLKQSKPFWANVRTLGQAIGYKARGQDSVRVPSIDEIRQAYEKLGLRSSHLVGKPGKLQPMGKVLLDYLAFRAHVLEGFVEPRLMDAARAKKVFESLKSELRPRCPIPMNKQKGKKKAPAYFTGIINMLIERHSNGADVDYDPRQLTTITLDSAPLRTLSRRIDGAFPGAVNPVAVWEIKEYYYTTTFGSRVADGVYETLLDGMELEELKDTEGISVRHYLMIDGHYTWWACGKSYLCRVVDMLHMGYVDEVLFGHEVVERLPNIVSEWARLANQRP